MGSVPHSNQALVARPFGLTVPLAVKEVAVTLVAALVVAVCAGPASVVREAMAPRTTVPPEANWEAIR